MKIYLPHINYTVGVKNVTIKGPNELPEAKAWVKSEGKHGCCVYIDTKSKILPGDLAHELVHVLQFICLHRNIDFVQEQEHMGYIMHYLMGRILGYKWQKN